MKIIKKVDSSISYEVNPYTELFGIISIIADNSELYREAGDEYFNQNYRNEILECFNSLRNHKAVLLLTKYTRRYQFNYDAPCALFLEMADNGGRFSDYISKERLPISTKKLDKLLEEIDNFIKDSDFESFYLNNKNRYKKSIDKFIDSMEDYSPEKYLFSLIGQESEKFVINLMHSVTNSNYGLSTEKNYYICIAPNGPSGIDGEPSFACSLSNITSLILHELAHSFINPLTKKHSNYIKNIDEKVFYNTFKNNPYGNNVETAVNETIIRSIECLYIKDFFPGEFDQFLNNYLLKGFSQIPKVVDLLRKFQKERTVNENLDVFYPEILKALM